MEPAKIQEFLCLRKKVKKLLRENDMDLNLDPKKEWSIVRSITTGIIQTVTRYCWSDAEFQKSNESVFEQFVPPKLLMSTTKKSTRWRSIFGKEFYASQAHSIFEILMELVEKIGPNYDMNQNLNTKPLSTKNRQAANIGVTHDVYLKVLQL